MSEQCVLPNFAERLDHPRSSPWWGEHRSRYRFAQPLVSGRHVLDVACGSGYGSELLFQGGAASVVGVDNVANIIAVAAGRARHGLTFVCADATALPVADRTFDVVVSFETLEHVSHASAFVAEIRRVMADNGVLVISTPNALHTVPVNGIPRNPFHVHEYSAAELHATLTRYFSSVTLFGQRPHPAFRPCPFWERSELLSSRPRDRARILAWKFAVRLPPAPRDRLWHLLHRQAFYPGEHDFVFDREVPEAGHVLVAICQP